MLHFAAITPHPPIIVPGVGNEEDLTRVADTVDSMKKLAKDFKEKEIDTVIVLTPHGSISKKTFNVYSSDCFTSSLPGALLSFDGSPDLAGEIAKEKNVKEVKEGNLDHGSSVPLYYFQEERSGFEVVPITFCMKSRKMHFNFGKKLFNLIQERGEKIAVIASGDLSHKLTPSAPAGYSEKGKEFDEKLINLLEKNKTKDVLEMDEELIDEAGQCGYRSIIILLGLLSETNCSPEVLSYEGPFGVGYGVIRYNLETNEN